jgi:hypothetical protein
MTECTQRRFAFEGHFPRQVVAEFSGDRLSAGTMRANQFRLYFSSLAYVLLDALRRIGLVAEPSGPRLRWEQSDCGC